MTTIAALISTAVVSSIVLFAASLLALLWLLRPLQADDCGTQKASTLMKSTTAVMIVIVILLLLYVTLSARV